MLQIAATEAVTTPIRTYDAGVKLFAIMKIVLTGYRATGKSTLANLLAKRLQWPCFDIDRGIEKLSQQTITKLYQDSGEKTYRDIESQVVREMCSQDQRIISFGAGSLIRPENQIHACRNAIVVYLQASAQELWQRITADPKSALTRPNHAGGGLEEVIEMLNKRTPTYENCATLTLDATLPSEQLAEHILETLSQRTIKQEHHQ